MQVEETTKKGLLYRSSAGSRKEDLQICSAVTGTVQYGHARDTELVRVDSRDTRRY
jgi:hypothetical protein